PWTPGRSNGSSMPISTPSDVMCCRSACMADRNVRTSAQPSAVAAATIVAPGCTSASPAKVGAWPARGSTPTVGLPASHFFTASGVAATTVSSGAFSNGIPICTVSPDELISVRSRPYSYLLWSDQVFQSVHIQALNTHSIRISARTAIIVACHAFRQIEQRTGDGGIDLRYFRQSNERHQSVGKILQVVSMLE